MFRPLALTAIALALSLTLAPSRAEAQEFYVFGDSLSDPGNLYRLTGNLLPASPPYFEGRYSNGPVWTEQFPAVAGISGSLANNYAVAGAKSGSASPNDVSNQIGGYLTSHAGKADSNGLYVVFSGANDYSGGLSTAPSAEALIAQVVGLTSQNVQSLAAAGARQFLVPNLPNLGDTPLGKASGAGATLNTVTAAHNAALQGEMARLEKALGVTITLVDTNALLVDIMAHPTAYGVTNTANPCLGAPGAPTGACPTDAAANASVFWDGQHPTQTIHTAFAQLAKGTLQTEAEATRGIAAAGYLSQTLIRSALSRLSVPAADAPVQTADSGAATSDAGTMVSPDGKTAVGLAIGGVFGSEDGDASLAGFDYSGWQAGLSADHRIDETFSIGAGVGYGRADADLDNDLGDVEASSWLVNLHAAARSGRVFGLAAIGASIDNYGDIDRATGNALLPTASGDSDGHSLFLSAMGGVDVPLSGEWTLTPQAGIDWVHSRIDGYTETGAGPLNLTVDDQTLNSVRGKALLRLAGEFADGESLFRPYIDLGVDHEFSGDTGDINARLASGATLNGNSSSGDDTRLLVGFGVDMKVDDALFAGLAYDGKLGSDSRNHAVTARVKWTF